MRKQKKIINSLGRLVSQQYRSVNLANVRALRTELEDILNTPLSAAAEEAVRILSLPPEEGVQKLGLEFILKREDELRRKFARNEKLRKAAAKAVHDDINATLTRVSIALDNPNPPLSAAASLMVDAAIASLKDRLDCANYSVGEVSLGDRTSYLYGKIKQHKENGLMEHELEYVYRACEDELLRIANPRAGKARMVACKFNNIINELDRYGTDNQSAVDALVITELPSYGEEFNTSLRDAVGRMIKFENAIIEINSIRISM